MSHSKERRLDKVKPKLFKQID